MLVSPSASRLAAALGSSLVAAALTAACGGSGSRPTAMPIPSAVPPTATPQPSPPTPAPLPQLRLGVVAEGLERPLFVTASPGDPDRLFVLEQTGRVRVIAAGSLRDDPFLDLSDVVSCCGERGLLGLAFHPGYAENGRFFVDYTDARGDTVVAEFARSSGSRERAEPEPTRVLLRVDQPFANHNGGMLAFGPDGRLYVGMGDGGAAGDPFDNAQDPEALLGKMLRIDVDAEPEPSVEVWDVGLRNPWRFSFDRATGDLYIGDVGQDLFEEIDVEPAGAGGRNYGWAVMEGRHCFRPPEGCETAGLTPPVVEYGHELGCSVTGGYVYRGRAIPGLEGRYLYGDFCTDRIWSFVWRAGRAEERVELTEAIRGAGRVDGLSSFGEDADGELYLTSLENGLVLRLEAASGRRASFDSLARRP